MFNQTIENLKTTTMDQFLVIVVVGIAIGFTLGLFSRGGIERQATNLDANTSLLITPDGHPLVTNVKGNRVPTCKEREGKVGGEFRRCKTEVVEMDGEQPILIDRDTKRPLKDEEILSFQNVFIWTYKGSHCSKHYWSGGIEIDLC